MALYHFTAKAISMGKGASAVHRAAYHARTQLYDDRNAKLTRDYAQKGDHQWSGIFAPKDAPAWVHDRSQLWNKAEAAERQANGQPARNIEFALPNELTREQQIRLVTDFCREQFARKGMIADASLHSDYDAGGTLRQGVRADEPRNDHVHVLLTMRRLDGDNFARTKTDAREWNSKAQLEDWRGSWARMASRALHRAGFEQEAQRFAAGHLTLPKQRQAAIDRGDAEWAEALDREADIKQGANVTQMEARGKHSERGEERRDIKARNAEREELRREAKIIDLELARLFREAQAEEAATRRQGSSGRSDAGRVAREKGRFEEWANARRAEWQNVRLEEDGNLGRLHTAQKLTLQNQLKAQYGQAWQAARKELKAIAGRQAMTGMRGRLYGMSRQAKADAGEASRLRLQMADMKQRMGEQRGGLAADQRKEQAILAATHARKTALLEDRIAKALDRREREGWVRAGGQDRQLQPRREATTGREVEDSTQAYDGAENSPVDASNDPGMNDPSATPEASPAPETGQPGQDSRPSDRTLEDEQARLDAERRAREQADRDFDTDRGRELDQ